MKNDWIKEYRLGNSTVWLLCLRELSDEEWKEMYARCSRERQEKTRRIKSELKQKQSLGAGYLLSRLKERFAIEEEPAALPEGKPVFPENSDIHFNISHSGDYAALAFGKTPLGMDIECVKRANLKVAKRFFQKEEYDCLMENEEAGQGDVFCKIWTGKEAVVKAAGRGLSMPLDSFSVLENPVECSEGMYELCQQKFAEEEKTFWISVAQVI